MSQQPKETALFSEVLVVGGGASGLVMALASAQAGFQTTLAAADNLEPRKQSDSRAFAMSPASMRVFEALGIRARLDAVAEPVSRMAIADNPLGKYAASTLRLDFAQADASEKGADVLAYIIENKELMNALVSSAETAQNLTLCPGRKLSGLEQKQGLASALFETSGAINAQLIVGADGRNSQVRNLCAIEGTGWAYDQTAIAATIAHDRAHNGVAHDIFMRAGPLGVLPLAGNRSSIVWCERPDAASELLKLSAEDFCAELETRLDGRLGKVMLEGQRSAFPLSLFVAQHMIAPRAALIADAAHTMHPLAGQGLNIGLRDVAALVDTIMDARALGMDIGAQTTLERYQRWRRFDNLSYAAATDSLNRIFAVQATPLRALRSAGLAAVNGWAPLRKMLAREASGLSDSAPRLLRGEALISA